MKCRIWTMASILAVVATVVLFSAAMAKPPTEGHAVEGLDRGAAVLVPTKGHDIDGTILFQEKDGVIHLSGEIRGLTPGLHGFHIHEFGDLRAKDGGSAGGHYNPCGTPHAGPEQEARHVGDLGNVEADANGVAKVDKRIDGAALHFILGRSIVVHAGEDDLSSQPSGIQLYRGDAETLQESMQFIQHTAARIVEQLHDVEVEPRGSSVEYSQAQHVA